MSDHLQHIDTIMPTLPVELTACIVHDTVGSSIHRLMTTEDADATTMKKKHAWEMNVFFVLRAVSTTFKELVEDTVSKLFGVAPMTEK